MADATVADDAADCAVCEELICKGDDIVVMDGWWCHADCAEHFDREERDDDR